MKYCPNCGEKVGPTDSFCSHCGFKLEKIESRPKVADKEISNVKTMPNSKRSDTYAKPIRTKQTIKKGVSDVNRQLNVQLNALYQQMAIKFNVTAMSGSLTSKFKKIKVQIFKQIEGYDYDEITNRIEPLCIEEHTATEDDIRFVESLISKYRNYGQPSKLEQQLGYLSGQSSNAIVDAEQLNGLQEYLHVNRGELETDFLKLIQSMNEQHGKLIFLVGNVGDGKSHLIGYLKQQHPQLFADRDIHIHYDATESFDPQKTALQTLTDVLQPFSDQRISNNNENWIVAINMGVLVNFIREIQDRGDFKQVIEYLNDSGIFTGENDSRDNAYFGLLSFRNYPLFELDESGTTSQFYDELFNKIVQKSDDNPFYTAYLEDEKHNVVRLVHRNFELFCRTEVRETLKMLLIKIQVESKVIISTRALLELIHDILVPTQLDEHKVITFRNTLPYLIFGESGDSGIVKKMKKFDPQYIQNKAVGQLVTRVFNSQRSLKEIALSWLDEKDAQSINWIWSYVDEHDLKLGDKISLLLRIKYLFDHNNLIFKDSLYTQYLKLLTEIRLNQDNGELKSTFFKMVRIFLYKWNGSPKNNYIFTFVNERNHFGVAIPFKVRIREMSEQGFNIVLRLKNDVAQNIYKLEIDYELFTLITKVNAGYLLKEKDRRNFVNVTTFIEKLAQSDQANEETLIGNIETNQFYQLSYDGIGQVEMEED